MDAAFIVQRTQRWIEHFVIALNLCPFADRVFRSGRIRYTVSAAAAPNALRDDLARELVTLRDADRAQVETTLLIHPLVLADFLDYNDFVADADLLLAERGLRGVIQFAGFHPQYRFADADPDDASNFTNRAPYPMLHLLRESSVTQAVAQLNGQAEQIPIRNVGLLRSMGLPKVLEQLKRCH
jgi:hypothetical protein